MKNKLFFKLINPSFVFIIVFSVMDLSCKQEVKADLILLNGKIHTLDLELAEAQAVAVSKQRILDVGNDNQIKSYLSGHTKVIDLKGNVVIPGLIEGHAHFLGLGYSKMELNLTKVKDWKEIIALVSEAVNKAEKGAWILGRGWHQEKWQELPDILIEGYPLHDELSEVSPDHPVILRHASGHAVLVNEKAMLLAGITTSTADPEGGRILRRSDGNPTGIFLENAEELITRAHTLTQQDRTPAQIEADKIRAIELAIKECHENGITSFHDAGEDFETIDLMKRLADQNRLGVRLWVMIGEDNDKLKDNLKKYKIINYGNHTLTVRSIKRFMDGALGSRGAWLLEPYSDLLSSSGLNTMDLDEFRQTVKLAVESGYQVCTHAIGDRANRQTLDIYEEIFKAHPEKTDLRWRIEHAQHLHAEDIPRFGQLGVIAAMQANHCTSDGPWVPKRLGNKRSEEGAYVWQKLMQSGAVVSNGTDAPLEDIDPIANFYSLVTRRMKNGQTFYPDQAMSRKEALRAYTYQGAYSGFEEDFKGSITAGKLADLTILSQDILSIPEEKILETKIVYTIIGGEIKYKNPELIE